ncbi:putative mannosylphosphorylation protein, partial [Amniculicola lignicola CBS 123094]
MHLPLSMLGFLLVALPQLSQSAPVIAKRDADLESMGGLTTVTQDWSGKRGDPEDKYFHESIFHPHYDGRFASDTLPDSTRRQHLKHLVKTYLSTMHTMGAETWIMHGSLLGWWWNRRIMPWDSDIDVQVSERSIAFLANYHNMTVHHFNTPVIEEDGTETSAEGEGRNYLLEVNPHWTNGSTTDWLNVIDARWIDMTTGLFIDITTLRRTRTAEDLGVMGNMMCKDKHHYLERQIFPLRESTFEGIPVKIPYSYTELLKEEYGEESLVKTEYGGHKFVKDRMEWIPWREQKGYKIPDDKAFRQFAQSQSAKNSL